LTHNEPALLIGETGCGKTTICQLLAAYSNQKIRILNCHQSTESSDIIGGLRPVRGKEMIKASVVSELSKFSRLIFDNLDEFEKFYRPISDEANHVLMQSKVLFDRRRTGDMQDMDDEIIQMLLKELGAVYSFYDQSKLAVIDNAVLTVDEVELDLTEKSSKKNKRKRSKLNSFDQAKSIDSKSSIKSSFEIQFYESYREVLCAVERNWTRYNS
jgi:ABC-type dipeptide/oligopeptide/nickel transport system ATPase component